MLACNCGSVCVCLFLCGEYLSRTFNNLFAWGTKVRTNTDGTQAVNNHNRQPRHALGEWESKCKKKMRHKRSGNSMQRLTRFNFIGNAGYSFPLLLLRGL